MLLASKNIKNMFLKVLPIKLFALIIKLANRLFSTGKNAVNKFIEAILKEYDYCRLLIEKRFDKNLVITAKDKKYFKSSNKCWICHGLFTEADNKVRDQDLVTCKYRGFGHWDCNINLKLTKRFL